MGKKLTVIETAELLGVSKEAIYNRIRRGSLETIVENGTKYVILTNNVKKTSYTRKIDNSVSDAYIQLLKDELQELKVKNKNLEADKERLVKEKENLLIESKEKLEQIYKQRDEQLKAILKLATRPTLENKNNFQNDIVKNDGNDTIEVDIDKEEKDTNEIIDSYENWQDLRDYLKEKGYSKKEKKIIKEEINKKIGIDDDIKYADGKVFVKKNKKNKNLKKMLNWV